MQQKEYYQKNRETILRQKKEYYRINCEKIKEYRKSIYDPQKEREFHCKNKEKRNAKSRKWYHENRERAIQNSRIYRQRPEFAEINRLRTHEVRAKKKNTGDGSITVITTQKLLIQQKNRCNKCGKDIQERTERHLDHIKPLSKGGVHTIQNVQWLCVKCNYKKSNIYEEEKH